MNFMNVRDLTTLDGMQFPNFYRLRRPERCRAVILMSQKIRSLMSQGPYQYHSKDKQKPEIKKNFVLFYTIHISSLIILTLFQPGNVHNIVFYFTFIKLPIIILADQVANAVNLVVCRWFQCFI